MKQLDVSYSVWEQVIQTNDWSHYHLMDGYRSATIWTGTQDYIYKSNIDADDYGDWQIGFGSSSTIVTKEDDAIALILNLGSPTTITTLDCPTENDGRPVMVVAPFSTGLYMWVTSYGDDLNTNEKAEGQHFHIHFDDYGEGNIELEFLTPFELHDGQVTWRPLDNWNFDDKWSFHINMPATEVTPNGTGTGNCNLYPIGLNKNLIIPAYDSQKNPNGWHNIDLDQAVPIPSGNSGYYECDRLTGEVTVSSTPGQGGYYLLDHSKTAYFFKNISCGHPLGVFDFDAYKCEWISERWKLCFHVNKVAEGSGEIGGWIMTYRSDTTEDGEDH